MIKNETSMRVLAAARRAWESASDLRSHRSRAKRFTYGDQWSDIRTGIKGNGMTEGAHMQAIGREPMTNNLIHRLVRCIVGHFRTQVENESRDAVISNVLEANSADEIDSRMLEEFLISGCAIQRVVDERRSFGRGIWIDNVNPRDFFITPARDPRGWDTEMVGMLHQMSLQEAMMRFAKGDRRRAQELRRLYSSLTDTEFEPLFTKGSEVSFSRTGDGRCRVIEVWTLEAAERIRCHDPLEGRIALVRTSEASKIDAINQSRAKSGLPAISARWDLTTRWHCRWLAPDGTLLDEYDSPLANGQHPFVVKFHPLTDGEVHSLVEDVLDQQIYINNLITTINHIMNCSAKGALLFPEGSISKYTDWNQVTQLWAQPDAVIPYKPGPKGEEPHQAASKGADIGARELLALEIQMFEDVSGVSNALMGKSPGGNAGVERYESEVRNALVSIKDLLATFDHFRKMRNEIIKNLM